MRADKEKNVSFNQNQGSMRRSKMFRVTTQKHRLSKDGDENKEGVETVAGTSEFFKSLEEERATMSLASPDQIHSADTRGPNPTATITAWEAGWNVTNAIQVHLVS